LHLFTETTERVKGIEETERLLEPKAAATDCDGRSDDQRRIAAALIETRSVTLRFREPGIFGLGDDDWRV
jgi:hypothetical protein